MRYAFLLLLVFLSSCTVDRTVRSTPISSISLREEVSLTYSPSKICYENLYKTNYILDRTFNKIYIYENGVYKNVIGGIGTGRTNFQRLADISLAVDGGIFALDSAEKKIKKFDRNGQWITDWSLDSFKRPERFVVDNENNMYIFDFFGRTISFYNLLSSGIDFDFGRFAFSNIENINLIGDRLVIWDKQANQTLVYSTIGKEILTLTGRYTADRFGNYISLNDNYIQVRGNENKYCFSADRYTGIGWSNGMIYLLKSNSYVPVGIDYAVDR
ncbi:MAG: 6-bladed beta-propeller [Candidatus Cloacimonetes bacterium]|nr:6-bladed beta-propeller [Candidatus Cloacimonadota bacterium]